MRIARGGAAAPPLAAALLASLGGAGNVLRWRPRRAVSSSPSRSAEALDSNGSHLGLPCLALAITDQPASHHRHGEGGGRAGRSRRNCGPRTWLGGKPGKDPSTLWWRCVSRAAWSPTSERLRAAEGAEMVPIAPRRRKLPAASTRMLWMWSLDPWPGRFRSRSRIFLCSTGPPETKGGDLALAAGQRRAPRTEGSGHKAATRGTAMRHELGRAADLARDQSLLDPHGSSSAERAVRGRRTRSATRLGAGDAGRGVARSPKPTMGSSGRTRSCRATSRDSGGGCGRAGWLASASIGSELRLPALRAARTASVPDRQPAQPGSARALCLRDRAARRSRQRLHVSPRLAARPGIAWLNTHASHSVHVGNG
jgi:hypothetical protein